MKRVKIIMLERLMQLAKYEVFLAKHTLCDLLQLAEFGMLTPYFYLYHSYWTHDVSSSFI